MINGIMPATPLPLGTETTEGCQDLTKREMMAMHIPSGPLSDYEFDVTRQKAAEIAVQQADALLAELEKSQ